MSKTSLSFKSRPGVMMVVGLMIVTCGVLYLCFGRTSDREWTKDLRSPDGTYRVQIVGKSHKPIAQDYRHGNHSVTYTVSKGGAVVGRDVPLYGGSQNDDLFQDLFPAQEWVSNSTLRFGQKTSADRSRFDRIIVTNKSVKTFEIVRVNFGVSEILLTFDVPPQERKEFMLEPQTDQHADRSGIYVYLYASGVMTEKAAGFELRGRYKEPATYYIDISDSGVEIRSDYLKQVS